MPTRKLRYLIPKDRAELIPMFFIIFIIFVYVIFELHVILPTIYHNIFTYKEILHLIFGFYIIFNLLGNLYLCLMTDTSIDTVICPVILPTGESKTSSWHCNWHYCYQCQVNAPPRAEHCHLCRKCILKRDYHCSFFGKCIGFRNLRYYLCFLVWSWIGLIYCNILHMDYTYELVGTFSWRFIIACLFPLGAWLFSLLDHFSLVLSCLCSTSIVLSLTVTFLIIQQISLICRSQTKYESKNNIRLYQTGRNAGANMKLVLGKQWYLILFSPLIYSSPMGDGMTFDMNINQIKSN